MTMVCGKCGHAFERHRIVIGRQKRIAYGCPKCDYGHHETIEERARRYADRIKSWCESAEYPDKVSEMVWDVAYQAYLDGHELVEPDTIDKD